MSLLDDIEELKEKISHLPDNIELKSMFDSLDKISKKVDGLELLILEVSDILEHVIGTKLVELQYYRNKMVNHK